MGECRGVTAHVEGTERGGAQAGGWVVAHEDFCITFHPWCMALYPAHGELGAFAWLARGGGRLCLACMREGAGMLQPRWRGTGRGEPEQWDKE
jgi:hypothetical protein